MNIKNHAISDIVRNDLCVGCGICAAISGGSIEMKYSSDGYLRPQVASMPSLSLQQKISDICPGVALRQEIEGQNDHFWGSIIGSRAGFSTNESLRFHASSGGALSAILVYLINEGLVDHIIQTKSSKADPLSNTTVLSTTFQDIFSSAGSRYLPSAPLADIRRHLQSDKKFAFVGKPCDVAALRALGRDNPNVTERIPVMLSFFCAGIPSLHGTQEILKALEVEERDVIQFQYRGNGWPGKARATLANGNERSLDYASSWGGILSKHLQFRCKICPDGSGNFADIVCGDAWHCDENGYPLFVEGPGRSLILSRTETGESIVQQAIASGYLTAQPFNAEELKNVQPHQARRKILVLSRIMAIRAVGRLAPRYQGFSLLTAAITGGIVNNVKSFIGMLVRIFLNRH